MKTLDETIKNLEDGLKHLSAILISEETWNDALHYLKEYQRYQNTPSRNGYMALVDYFEKSQKNDPLTWDELKAMEGKPVWIEAESLSVGVSPYWKDWYIIKSFSNDEFMYCNDGFEWAKEMQGQLWQAYRKERENVQS